MAAGYPASNNTFIPSFEASGKMIVQFSKNPKDFALNRYIQQVPVKKSVGYYLKLTPENAARILSANVSDFIWHDGQDAPHGEWNTDSHEFVSFATLRYAFPFRLGYKSVEQADWQILAVEAANHAHQAMTGRAVNTVALATTNTNYPSAHRFASGTALAGAALNSGTETNPILKKGINKLVQTIQKATLGKIRHKDLHIVMGPALADELSRSQEVHSYIARSPFALAQIRGDAPNQNGAWGLPEQLYGVPIEIEDTVYVTQRKGATAAPGYIWPANTMVMLSRVGGLVSTAGGPNFSTIVQFVYEDMTVEQKDDPDNRRHSGRVVDDYTTAVVAGVSGAIVESALT